MLLAVHSIFESISGEAGGFPQGTWCTFIRLQGCNLRCVWCDIPESRASENPIRQMSLVDLMSEVRYKKNKHILITGGEPLSQPGIVELIYLLLSWDYKVQLETNGSIIIPPIPGVHWVIDYKGPSSGEHFRMESPSSAFAFGSEHLKALQNLQEKERAGSIWIKYVVANQEDLGTAIDSMYQLHDDGLFVPFIISPIDAKGNTIPTIINYIKDKGASLLEHIIFSIQIHKLFDLP